MMEKRLEQLAKKINEMIDHEIQEIKCENTIDSAGIQAIYDCVRVLKHLDAMKKKKSSTMRTTLSIERINHLEEEISRLLDNEIYFFKQGKKIDAAGLETICDGVRILHYLETWDRTMSDDYPTEI